MPARARPLRPALLALALAAPALAPSRVNAAPTAAAAVEARARAHVAAVHALPSNLTLVTRRVYPWAAGTHVRLQQRLAGVPVEGRDLVVSLDRRARPTRLRGTPLAETALALQPSLAPAVAAARAEELIDAMFGPPRAPAPWPPRHELRVWVDARGDAHLAWAIELARRGPGRAERPRFQTYRVLVDAHDGAPLHARPSSFNAQANVYPQSPANSELEEVTLARLLSDEALDGEYATVRSCTTWEQGGGGLGGLGECAEVGPLATPDQNGDYFFEPDPTSSQDPLAEVQMYHHLDLVAHYFDETFGFAHGAAMEGIVNFELDNAFYGDADGDGQPEVAFGQGALVDFAYDADVIYHEYVHSVFDGLTDLGFFGADEYGIHFAAGGLNEGTADLFALAITLDPKLGEYAGLGFELDAIRDLEADRRCPHDLHGEVHKDGEIWGAAGWNMIEDPAVGPDVTAQLIYGAVAGWGAEIGWDSAGESLLTTAADMLTAEVITQAQHDAIVAHVEASGMPGCERVIPLDDGLSRTLYLMHIGFLPDIDGLPATAQLSLQAPEDASALRFTVEGLEGDEGVGYTIYVREGAHVRHEVEDFGLFQVPTPVDYDLAVPGQGTGFELTLDESSELALTPGATYYFALASADAGAGQAGLFNAEITVSASVELAGETDSATATDASTGGTGDDSAADASSSTDAAGSGEVGTDTSTTDGDSGCGCASDPRGRDRRAPAAWLGALILLALRRRR